MLLYRFFPCYASHFAGFFAKKRLPPRSLPVFPVISSFFMNQYSVLPGWRCLFVLFPVLRRSLFSVIINKNDGVLSFFLSKIPTCILSSLPVFYCKKMRREVEHHGSVLHRQVDGCALCWCFCFRFPYGFF